MVTLRRSIVLVPHERAALYLTRMHDSLLKLGAFWRVQRTIWRSPVGAGRRLLLSALFAAMLAWGALNVAFLWLDHLLFPGFRKVRVRAPIFIIAHPRSGTTLTHRLMLKDPGRYSFARAYELLLPSITQKKLVRGLGWIDRRWLRGTLHGWVRSKESAALGELQDIHHFSLLEAEEDEWFYFMTFASGVSLSLFPYVDEFRDVMTYDRMPPEAQRQHMQYYHGCLMRQLYLDGPGKVFCSKNTTTFIHKIGVLSEMYPDSRFVHIVRNPCEVAPSLLSLLGTTWRQMGFPEEDVRSGLAVIHETNMRAYEVAFEALDALPPGRVHILDYRDIAAAPKATMMATYEALGIEMTPEYAKILDELELRARAHVSGHSYGLEEYGLSEAAIRAAAPTFFERYDFGPS